MTTRTAQTTTLGVLAAALGVAACGDDDQSSTKPRETTATETPSTRATNNKDQAGRLPCGREPVKLDPADFTTTIDNPYFPIRPGSRWSYRGTDHHGGTKHLHSHGPHQDEEDRRDHGQGAS